MDDILCDWGQGEVQLYLWEYIANWILFILHTMQHHSHLYCARIWFSQKKIFFFLDNTRKIYHPYQTLAEKNPYKFMTYKTWM